MVLPQRGRRVLRLRYADGCEYHVDAAGTRVACTWPAHFTVEDAATYLLGPVFGLVLRLRGIPSLHASAVALGDRSVAMCGPAGTGKSTTAAALAARGRPAAGGRRPRPADGGRTGSWRSPRIPTCGCGRTWSPPLGPGRAAAAHPQLGQARPATWTRRAPSTPPPAPGRRLRARRARGGADAPRLEPMSRGRRRCWRWWPTPTWGGSRTARRRRGSWRCWGGWRAPSPSPGPFPTRTRRRLGGAVRADRGGPCGGGAVAETYDHRRPRRDDRDRVRMDAYAAALERAVRPGCVVLDIGTGTG